MTATVYGQKIQAHTMTALKRKATMIANGFFNPADEMQVCFGPDNKMLTYTRVNRKAPNNTICRGQWR